MQRLSRRKKSPPSARGRAPARWTGLEVLLVLMSVVMIAFPLYASTLTIVSPPSAPAQGLNADDATTEPGATNAPAADTDVPKPADTDVPQPADTDVPKPADTDVPQAVAPVATDADAAAPADTAAPAQADTAAPPPTNTDSAPVGDPNQRVTRTPEQLTTTTGGAAPTNTAAPAAPTDTVEPGRATSTAALPSATTAPGVPSDTPAATDTAGPESPTVTPFAPPVAAPLELIKFASVSSAAPGQQFSYSLSVRTTSVTAITVAVRDAINSQLQVLSVSQTTGSCSSGQTVNCTVTVQNGSPASITIQVRANATAQGTISNQASASSSGTTAASELVAVAISGNAVPTSTNAPGVTNTPTSSGNGNPPTSTPINGVTNTPVPGASITPTSTKTSSGSSGGSSGGSSSGGNKKNDKATETPPPPPPPPEQQTVVAPAAPATSAAPGATARAVVRRSPTRAVVRITPVPGVAAPAAAAATNSPAPVASQPSPTLSGPPVGDTNVFFRIASDWGSASPGQEVRYTLLLRNTRPANGNNDLRDVSIRTTLPNNLEVTNAVASQNDVTRAGNDVSLGLDAVRPGETVAMTITTKIKPDVAIGTLVVAQGQTSYAALGQPLFSNVVTLLVVGTAPPAITVTSDSRFQAPITSTVGLATATSDAYPAPSSAASTIATTAATTTAATAATSATSATAAASATILPAATVTRIPAGGVTAPGGTAPLPDTSTGVPLLGFGLLGLTMLVRTLRLHRARERI